jgi:hypothetical protein
VTLGVELINNRDIVISSPESGFSVTYRKDGDAPMLVAIDGIGRVFDQAKVKFWGQAWKAAHEKARAVGWAKLLALAPPEISHPRLIVTL